MVPTDPAQVKKLLRRIGEPVTLFGEREPERRDRLKKLMAMLTDDQVAKLTGQADLLETLTTQVQVRACVPG